MMTDWHGEVELAAGQVTTEQLAAVGAAAPGYSPAVFDAGTGRLTVSVSVEAGTLRQAVEQALRVVRDAAGEVLGGRPAAQAVRVVPFERVREEIARPGGLDLVGMVEAGEVLGVSRQRVYELASTHPDFPAPVADLAAGKVFTRASVEAFGQRWQRRPGRPPRRAE